MPTPTGGKFYFKTFVRVRDQTVSGKRSKEDDEKKEKAGHRPYSIPKWRLTLMLFLSFSI